MTAVVGDLRRCLETMDVPGFRVMWNHFFPHMPVPVDNSEMVAAMHMARTNAKFMAKRGRAYSHAWLTERGLPSMLPDELKPSAERMYPQVVNVVGISVNASSPVGKLIVPMVREAMEKSVLESFADDVKDPAVVKQRMMEAKERTMKKLIGVVSESVDKLR